MSVLRSMSKDFDNTAKKTNIRCRSKRILINASSDFTSVTSNNPYNEVLSTVTGGKSSKMSNVGIHLKPPLQGRKQRTKHLS